MEEVPYHPHKEPPVTQMGQGGGCPQSSSEGNPRDDAARGADENGVVVRSWWSAMEKVSGNREVPANGYCCCC